MPHGSRNIGGAFFGGFCTASPGADRSNHFKGGSRTRLICCRRRRGLNVLRRKPPGKLLPSAHAVDREFRVISALAAQGFPVAEPVVYCADESVTARLST